MTESEESPKPLRMPGDRGLPGLGLMMQLWAGLEALTLAVALIFMLRLSIGASVAPLGLAVLGIIRALVHFVAGMEIRAGGMNIPSRVRALLVVSVVYFAIVLSIPDAPISLSMAWSVADILLWPLFLVVVFHLPAWRERFAKLREGELELRGRNRGIEGAGAIMVVLGSSGVVFMGALSFVWLGESNSGLSLFGDVSAWIPLSVVVLLLRSVFHVSVGLRALLGATPETFHRLVRTYVRIHWVSTLIAVAPVLYGVYEGVDLMGTLTLTIITMLSVWPLVLQGFAAQVGGDSGEFADFDFDVDANTTRENFGRAPDGGSVTMGWFLCALAVSSLVHSTFVLVHGTTGFSRGGLLTLPGWFVHESLPVWTPIFGVALTAWAGLELVTGSPRARIAALVFASCSILMAIWIRLEEPSLLDALGSGPRGSMFQTATLFSHAAILLSMIVPAMVVFLALRKRDPQ